MIRGLLALIFVLAVPTHAQESRQRLMSPDEANDWQGVGRLNIAGNRFCTASLISPDLILTAAHCLFHPETGVQVPLSQFRFVAGWNKGEYAALRKISAGVTHAGFSGVEDASYGSVGSDLALMRLLTPVPGIPYVPLSLSKIRGRDFTTVSYARNRPHAPSIRHPCMAGPKSKPEVIVLSCPIDHGESGAPVLAWFGNELRIVAVISAMAEARDGGEFALAVPVARHIDNLVTELSGSDWPK